MKDLELIKLIERLNDLSIQYSKNKSKLSIFEQTIEIELLKCNLIGDLKRKETLLNQKSNNYKKFIELGEKVMILMDEVITKIHNEFGTELGNKSYEILEVIGNSLEEIKDEYTKINVELVDFIQV